MWIRLLGVGNIGTIDLEAKVTGRERDITTRLSGGNIFHWVVVVDLLDGRRGLDRLLSLGDNHTLWCRGERRAFFGVEIHILGVNLVVIVHRCVPRDSQFYIVILERHQWDSGLPVFTEGKSEWVERGISAVRSWRLCVVLGHDSWRNVLGKMGGLFIDDLATDQPFNFLDSTGPLSLAIGSWSATSDIAISEEIPLTLKSDSGDATIRWGPLEDLTLYSCGKVRVTTIARAPKAYFGLADEMGILGTDGDELGNTTRHFIYIEVIFLNRIIFT